MYATDDLRDEHEGIKVALAVLERLSDDAEEDKAVDLDDIEHIIDFLRTFADKCHHGKDEELLFPALVEAGIPNLGGPIGVMLAEHVQGRKFIAGMVDSLQGLRADDPDGRGKFIESARGYAELLSAHIFKENNVLFPMAEAQLSAAQHEKLSEGFDEIENERIGPGVHEAFHALLDQLDEKYLKSRV